MRRVPRVAGQGLSRASAPIASAVGAFLVLTVRSHLWDDESNIDQWRLKVIISDWTVTDTGRDGAWDVIDARPRHSLVRVVESRIHTVRPGETLGGIARRHGTTVAALVRINGIGNPDFIFIGQEVRVR